MTLPEVYDFVTYLRQIEASSLIWLLLNEVLSVDVFPDIRCFFISEFVDFLFGMKGEVFSTLAEDAHVSGVIIVDCHHIQFAAEVPMKASVACRALNGCSFAEASVAGETLTVNQVFDCIADVHPFACGVIVSDVSVYL